MSDQDKNEEFEKEETLSLNEALLTAQEKISKPPLLKILEKITLPLTPYSIQNLSTISLAIDDPEINKVFKNALTSAIKIPNSLLLDWEIKTKEDTSSRDNTSEEEFSDAFEDFKDIPKGQKCFLKILTSSLTQNKTLKIENLKFPSQNVVDWFERFELLTTRWSQRDRGYEVVKISAHEKGYI
ncbi:hypothetical protein BpHYR1_030406 [Brachionus plicatilis]|uniref:Uncharacterized protein n=1 Tax=Brachionus plicatilis TaxID=10195 RepID=A0A3M7PEU5_BRAPC|nr:hypothetical protein BpHYR1_030406 [Brachionus plicatilis]